MGKLLHYKLHVASSTLPFVVGKINDVVQFLTDQIISSQDRSKIILPASLNDLAIVSAYPQDAEAYKGVDYYTTDGMPLVWWARWRTKQSIDRVYGPDILHLLIRHKELGNQLVLCSSEKVRVHFLAQLQKHQIGTHVELCVIGKWSDLVEQKNIVTKIKKSKSRVIWIGIGSPNQVKLADDLRKRVPSGVTFFCVGAAIPFFAGLVPQAPRWMQQSGVEWFFRLVNEPRRLWKRYLLNLPIFLYGQVFEKTIGKKRK